MPGEVRDYDKLIKWLTPEELTLYNYRRTVFFSDHSSTVMLESLEALAEARARISRMEATAEAREKQIRELTERCQQRDITRLSEWPRMVRAIRTYVATDMESSERIGNGAFAIECADDFASAAMDEIGPDALVQDTGMEKP